MKKVLLALAPCLLLAASASLLPASAQKRRAAAPARPDARVERALKALNYRFSVGDDAAFIVMVDLEGGRSQMIEVESVGPRESHRSVFSHAMLAPTIPPAVKGRLARANAETDPLKPWDVMKYRNGETATYFTVVEADCDDETLQDTIVEVATEADAMEQALTGEDKF